MTKNGNVASDKKIDNGAIETTDMEKLVENPLYILELNKKGLMVFGGKIDRFRSEDTYNDGTDKPKSIKFRIITKFDKCRMSQYTVDGYSFLVFKGVDEGNHFTLVYKDGIPIISNIYQSSLKNTIGNHKGWNKSQMEKNYLIGVDRLPEEMAKGGNNISI
jgi:hypothetical protein